MSKRLPEDVEKNISYMIQNPNSASRLTELQQLLVLVIESDPEPISIETLVENSNASEKTIKTLCRNLKEQNIISQTGESYSLSWSEKTRHEIIANFR